MNKHQENEKKTNWVALILAIVIIVAMIIVYII